MLRTLTNSHSASRRPSRRRRRSRRRTSGPRHRVLRALLLLLAVISGLGLTGVGVVFAGYTNYASQLPDPATLRAMEPALDSHVYARDGTLIATFHNSDFRHEHIGLGAISRWVLLATIDVEDRHFYQNGSWDLPRIIKSGWDNIRHTSATTQGASTITEQLAKISFLCEGNCDVSFDRKIKQVILGNEIEANFSKDEILEMYLNRIAYGNHAIGIETAAQLYLHKSAHDLDLAEASLLSGLPNSPTEYNPTVHDAGVAVNPLAKKRQRVVLEAMVSNGDITQAQADAAYNEALTFHPWWDSEVLRAPHFVDYLRTYLEDRFGDAYLRPGGWEIKTTLDLARQTQAEKSLHDGIASIYGQYNAHDGALVSVEPQTGEVLAMVGAWDATNPGVGDLNMATRRVRPGSTIKLFTYTAGIGSRQFAMNSPILDAPTRFDDGSRTGYTPLNYDRRFHGICPLAVCLGNSFNVPAVKVEAAVGIPYITNLEIAAGLTSLDDPADRPSPRNFAATLGGLTYGITPLELANGAATIAAMGVHHDPAPVIAITERVSGHVIYQHDATHESQRVIPDNVAFIMNEITSNDANRLAEFGPHGPLTLPDRRVSAKTGTTDFFEDNWTVGWTPDLVTSVWVGNPTPSCLNPDDSGRLAAAIQRKRLLYPGLRLDDPFSPRDLAYYGLSPINDHCGHLEGSTGITGAAPIWNDYMHHVLSGVAPTWYTRPADVIATSPSDNGLFFLPGTQSGTAQTCTYHAPSPSPGNQCDYLGPAPSPTPRPAYTRYPSPVASPSATAFTP